MSHTPGPWTTRRHRLNPEQVLLQTPDGIYPLFEAYNDVDDANARLIAAAPDLLAALRLPLLFHSGGIWTTELSAEWKSITGKDEVTTKVMCDSIRAAIAKATGNGS